MKRSEARERLFKVLFQLEFHEDFDQIYKRLLEEEGLRGTQGEYATSTIENLMQNIFDIDDIIKSNLKGWTFERLPKDVIAVLRLGVYELLYNKDVPDVSAINEAVKIAYEYSDPKEGVFINGILHSVFKNKESIVAEYGIEA